MIATAAGLGAEAATYAERGFAVFLLAPRSKTPLLVCPITKAHKAAGRADRCPGGCGHDGHGVLDATTDPATIAAWWLAHPTANIGLAVPPGMFVLDVDPRSGGHLTLERLEATHGPLPPTLRANTGAGDGGHHLWFRHPGGTLRVPRDHPGLDLKTSSGYVVAPSSIHPNGGRYAWVDHSAATDAPAWLIDLLRPPPPVPVTPRPSVATAGPAHTDDSIAEWYTANRTWHDVLSPHGWRALDAEGTRWLHPTATSPLSATVTHDCLFVYSTNTPFEPTAAADTHGYTRFRAFAVLDHGGDMSAAAAAARAQHRLEHDPHEAWHEWEARLSAATAPTVNGAASHVAQEVTGGPTAPIPAPVVNDALRARVVADLGADDARADGLTRLVAGRVDTLSIDRLARTLVAEQAAERDQALNLVVAVRGDVFLTQLDDPVRPFLGDLAHEGHNVTITAAYKVGKTTVVENIIVAVITGTPFLGRFAVTDPKRLVLLNHELTTADQRARLRALGLDDAALERLLIVNLRGKRLAITTPTGADHLVGILEGHRADAVAIDPWGVSIAQCGLDENKNPEARLWTTALDEIKDRAGCPTAFIPAHTGRGEQAAGTEHGRGATALDDWADVRLILTRTSTGERFIYSQGRAVDLAESRLTFDEATRRLTLDAYDLGVGRRHLQGVEHTSEVVAAVADEPGCTARHLEAVLVAGGVSKEGARTAVAAALAHRLIHFHDGPRKAHLHHLGPGHPLVEPCPSATP